MGGIILTNALAKMGEDCFLSASAVINSPIEMHRSSHHFDVCLSGKPQYVLGNNAVKVLERNADIMTPIVKEKCRFDLLEKIKELREAGQMTMLNYDRLFTVPLFGYESLAQYFNAANIYNNVP